MIFYCVVGPSTELLGDLCPSVANQSVRKKKDPLFLGSPIVLLDVGTEVVMPSFSALLAHSSCV